MKTGYVPATTSDVPMKESMAVAYLGLRSLSDLDANLQRQVATPSTMAPYRTGTCVHNHKSH